MIYELLYETVLDNHTKNPDYLDHSFYTSDLYPCISTIYYLSLNYSKAIEISKESIKLGGFSLNAYFIIAQSLESLGSFEKASILYEKLLNYLDKRETIYLSFLDDRALQIAPAFNSSKKPAEDLKKKKV